MSSWHPYGSLYSFGHKALENLFQGPVIIEEKVDGCVSPDARILTVGLDWVKAGNLRPGDKIIAFEDKLNNPRLIESEVTVSQEIRKPCYKIKFTDREIIASADHPWLVRQKLNNNGKRWVETSNLKIGQAVVCMPTWEFDNSWSSGYVAGFFDGEGSLVKSGNQRILSCYQRTGDTLDKILKILEKDGFNFNVDIRQRREDWSEVASFVLRHGSWVHILRFLGKYKPNRLLNDSKKIWNETKMNYIPDTDVVSVEYIGDHAVQGLSTSSRTYIAEGLFSHNSQFSFGVFDGELRCRSKGKVLEMEAPEKMFNKAVFFVQNMKHLLHEGWTYRAEYLQKPKHNSLAYDRTPAQNLIIFDINDAQESYLSYGEKVTEARRLGLEVVPLLHMGGPLDMDGYKTLLETVSCLGGQKIEGFVVKNYSQFGPDKKALMAKYVSEAFKEVHAKDWKERNPGRNDVILDLGDSLKTPARWNKAVQHLKEKGLLTNSPKDIGPLLKEVNEDILKECKEEICEVLFKWAWPQLSRIVISGLPQWYKEELLKQTVEGNNGD